MTEILHVLRVPNSNGLTMYLEFQKRRDGRVLLTVVEEDGVRRSAVVSDTSDDVLRLPAPVREAAESLRGIWRDLPHGDMLTLTL